MFFFLFWIVGQRDRHSGDASGVEDGPEPDNSVQMIAEVEKDD